MTKRESISLIGKFNAFKVLVDLAGIFSLPAVGRLRKIQRDHNRTSAALPAFHSVFCSALKTSADIKV